MCKALELNTTLTSLSVIGNFDHVLDVAGDLAVIAKKNTSLTNLNYLIAAEKFSHHRSVMDIENLIHFNLYCILDNDEYSPVIDDFLCLAYELPTEVIAIIIREFLYERFILDRNTQVITEKQEIKERSLQHKLKHYVREHKKEIKVKRLLEMEQKRKGKHSNKSHTKDE